VRVAACEALGRYGTEEDLKTVMPLLLKLANSSESNSFVAIHALNAISAIGKKAAPWKNEIVALPLVDPKSPARVNKEYTTNLVNRLKQTL
jgi:HEAT repeat protein